MLLFNKNSKVTKKNSAAINAYSGVFDPRSTIRDDYKFFLQSNRVGHQKAFSKMKLNLFIDRSGSFYPSVPMVNKIIYALQKIEKIIRNTLLLAVSTFMTVLSMPTVQSRPL